MCVPHQMCRFVAFNLARWQWIVSDLVFKILKTFPSCRSAHCCTVSKQLVCYEKWFHPSELLPTMSVSAWFHCWGLPAILSTSSWWAAASACSPALAIRPGRGSMLLNNCAPFLTVSAQHSHLACSFSHDGALQKGGCAHGIHEWMKQFNQSAAANSQTNPNCSSSKREDFRQ